MGAHVNILGYLILVWNNSIQDWFKIWNQTEGWLNNVKFQNSLHKTEFGLDPKSTDWNGQFNYSTGTFGPTSASFGWASMNFNKIGYFDKGYVRYSVSAIFEPIQKVDLFVLTSKIWILDAIEVTKIEFKKDLDFLIFTVFDLSCYLF